VEGYRSIRTLRLPLAPVTVVVGPNGCEKTNLYRPLRLLSAAAEGTVARCVADEGGLLSVLLGGAEEEKRPTRVSPLARWMSLPRDQLRADAPTAGSIRGRPGRQTPSLNETRAARSSGTPSEVGQSPFPDRSGRAGPQAPDRRPHARASGGTGVPGREARAVPGPRELRLPPRHAGLFRPLEAAELSDGTPRICVSSRPSCLRVRRCSWHSTSPRPACIPICCPCACRADRGRRRARPGPGDDACRGTRGGPREAARDLDRAPLQTRWRDGRGAGLTGSR
jgi:hypothetical protein